ncbi:MAG TPA: hypothetical protein VF834_00030, partial [Streptosporangiaceae bacterium]
MPCPASAQGSQPPGHYPVGDVLAAPQRFIVMTPPRELPGRPTFTVPRASITSFAGEPGVVLVNQ